ncbi:hypothetical protein EGW08_015321 [Elysia chlorotica]|uniref:Uncharacterized protein n=1 Tax=Elysia chlorotica TaxID=188477 RepID=A0A3S1HD25_ELYCH|nr:hypothetical protein EGW08_015321 [Elysia chlorotica]
MSARYVSTVDVRLSSRPRHMAVYVIRLSAGRPVRMPVDPPSPRSFRFALVPAAQSDQSEQSGQPDRDDQFQAVDSGQPWTESLTIQTYGGLETRGDGATDQTDQPAAGLPEFDPPDRSAVACRATSRTSYLSPHAGSVHSLLRAVQLELLRPESSPRDDPPASDSGLATDVSLSESMMSENWSVAEGFTPVVTPRSWSGSARGRGEDWPELTLWDADSAVQCGQSGRREWTVGYPLQRARRRISGDCVGSGRMPQ